MILTNIQRIEPTKKRAGILVRGNNHVDPNLVFDELLLKLYNFFSDTTRDEQLIMPTKTFNRNSENYQNTIYFLESLIIKFQDIPDEEGEIIDRKKVFINPRKYGNIKIIRLEPEKKRKLEDWDFPHAPFITRREKFLAYFNVYDKYRRTQRSLRERDAFLDKLVTQTL